LKTMNMQYGTVGIAAGPVLSAEVLAYAQSRGIGRQTLERLGVVSGTVFFPGLERKSQALFFRYGTDWKARSFPEKSFVTNQGAKLTFWGLENVLRANPDTVYLVEGEFDALALVEAGIPPECVLSLPNGAGEASDGGGYVEEALAAGLNRVQRFIWCGDGDDVGLKLRSEMVHRLGPARVWFVNWPEGTKDANDLLRTDGVIALRELVIAGALQWPVEGLFRLHEIPERPARQLWSLGFPEWNGKVMLAPATLSVVTGHPGHGKTHFLAQVWYNIVRANNLVAAVATFESQPKPDFRKILRALHAGQRDLTEEQCRAADAWISEHYLFLMHPDQRPTVEWILEMAEVAVIRHGARIIQIDPWNRLESARERNESETDYILRCLRVLHVFAQDMNVHVQILAHPAKMGQERRNQPPALEDIAGSKHWDNVPDQGFVVHRPQLFDAKTGMRQTAAKLFHRKARFPKLGYPCRLNIELDLQKYRFVPRLDSMRCRITSSACQIEIFNARDVL
jgi:twinkle protein